uniref:Family with sequence similarity 193 member A n=1 Tax=Oncorhynchus kisutch TaxID=8019 RepID=A0A8C7JC48_ONCKI
MSPTDAKRGAKRRKNKRGGGSSSTVCSTSGKAGVSATALSPQATATPVSTMGFLTPGSSGNGNMVSITGLNGERGDSGGTPFTFGLSQRAPYSTTGDRCLLCRSERKPDSTLHPDTGLPGAGQNGMAQSPSALHLPLWVCSDCRRTVEKEDRHSSLEQSQDFLLQMPMGNGGLGQEMPATGGRLTNGGTPPTLPTLPIPDLTTPMTADTVCSCEACNERREISAESERESQLLQNHWSEVRYLVRCIYRQTGTPLADDHDHPLDRDKEGMKELVDRLCEKDPYQLYQRLEQQAREYVLEMKVRLLKHLSTGSKAAAAAAQGPPQAHQFISLLLEEYSALCQAARTISSFLLTLENEHLQKFQVTWELHNKHLFENLVFSEPILHSSLPALVAQLRHGTASLDSYNEDMYRTLLESYQQLEQEMAAVAAEWQECEKRIDDYVDEQTLKTKQRMLKEDWEFFKQRRFIEEQLTSSKKSLAGDSNFTDTMRMLSSRLSIPDCPNCNYRRRCTCDDCSLSHILTCGIMDSPIAEDLHIKLPLQATEPPQHRDYLAEVHPPSLSSGGSSASASASSSPITIQQHSRLILPEGVATTFDDDAVPPLLGKFADIYPMGSYEDPGVVAGMNGLHSELNGGGENMALKVESPGGSSSSSSEGDEEEADEESCGEPSGQRREHSPGKSNSPPPYYQQQQVEQHACECHVCNQVLSSSLPPLGPAPPLSPRRIHTPPSGHHHQFFTEGNNQTPNHSALHLYPHIHGHLPLHNLSHLPRPLLHPTLYPSPPLSHSKPLPPSPTSSHTGPKQQAFSPSLPDHVYQNCFGGGAGDWNSSLQCLSLKFENICDAAMMKNWNPSVLLQEPLPGENIPLHLSTPLHLPPPLPSEQQQPLPRERKNTAKKKCLYNFQDAFLEANKVVMATSASTASVSCTATTVQSSNNHIQVSSKRPNSLGDVFHNIGKEDHRQQPGPIAPRNGPTASLPPLSSGPALPPAPGSTAQHHYPSMGSQPFLTTATPTPGFMEAHHQGMCLSPAEPPAAAPADGAISAPPSVCSDPECEGHRCEGNGAYDHQGYDGEESQDEDSCSEHSSSTSTSTNQKEGKYCDCCYCEFFGHGGPPAAPTSRNYAEMREKLRLRLTKRKEEQPKREEQPDPRRVEDHRLVEDLLQFINSASDNKPASSSKAAKRARHKQKKMEEKVRLEAEVREQQERRRQEEEAIQRELLRLQELQHLRAAKKKKDKAKELATPLPAPVPQNNPQPLKQTAQNVLENLRNGKSQLLHSLMRLPGHKDPRVEHRPQPRPPPSQHSPKSSREKALTPALFTQNAPNSPVQFLLNGSSAARQPTEANGKAKPKQQQPIGQSASETMMVKKMPEATTTNGTPQLPPDVKVTRPRPPAEDPVAPLAPGPRKEERSNGKRQHHQQSASQAKEERSGPLKEPSLPPASQTEQPQQNGKLLSAESPQPKAKSKKNKKKKADKMNNSIDDVFLPKDIDLDSTDMDETEREVEYFKRFCLDSARQTRQRLSINWSNFSLKKATFAAH